MAYYWFDLFPEKKVENLADLCIRIGMDNSECELPDRQWLSGGKVCLVRYTPREDFQLLVQSWRTCDYRTPEVRKFLKRVVDWAGVQQFYDGFIKPVDVALLR